MLKNHAYRTRLDAPAALVLGQVFHVPEIAAAKGAKTSKLAKNSTRPTAPCLANVELIRLKQIQSTLPVATVNEEQSVCVCVIKRNAGQIARAGIAETVIKNH